MAAGTRAIPAARVADFARRLQDKWIDASVACFAGDDAHRFTIE